jgi:4-alpha-glucanotransferase
VPWLCTASEPNTATLLLESALASLCADCLWFSHAISPVQRDLVTSNISAGGHGIGDFGPEAYRFVDFLQAAGQKLCQVLPLNPTGYAGSPFQCFSASAGNPLLISLDLLTEQGILGRNDLRRVPAFPVEAVDYGAASRFKMPLLQKAATNFCANASAADRCGFDKFVQVNATRLEDFALFMAVKEAHNQLASTSFRGTRARGPAEYDRD